MVNGDLGCAVMADAFEDYDLYSTHEDDECLRFCDPGEAIVEAVEQGEITDEAIAAGGTLTVYAFERMIPDIPRCVSLALEAAEELYDEDYGDPYGSTDSFSSEAYKAARGEAERALTKMLRLATSWACEEVVRREYSAEQVRAIVGEDKS